MERKGTAMVARDDQKLCGAKTKNGRSCRHYAGFRTSHPGFGRCYRHSGTTPSGKKVAAREVVAEIVRAVDARRPAFYGEVAPTNSRDALREELARSKMIVMHLEQMLGAAVGGLDPEARHAGLTVAQLETLKALHNERAHLVRASETATRLDLDTLDTAAIEEMANRPGPGLTGFILEVGLDPMNRDVRQAARNMLDKIAAERIEELRVYAGRAANDNRGGGR